MNNVLNNFAQICAKNSKRKVKIEFADQINSQKTILSSIQESLLFSKTTEFTKKMARHEISYSTQI